jgi:hypothetical protein
MNGQNKFFERLGVAFVVVLCVFSSWIFITQGFGELGDNQEPSEEDSKVNCEIYYFSNIVNSNSDEVGNYSCDEKVEGGVTQLPDFSVDEVHIISESVFDGDITFNGNAINAGTVNGNANFVGDFSENSGTINGTLTRTYATSTTTTRNFTQDSTHWTIIAMNSAVVDVTGATYDNNTVFSTLSGGSFVYPSVVNESLEAGRLSNNQSVSYSFPVIQNLNAKPLEFDNSKSNTKEKITKSETETKDEPSTSAGSSVEVVKTEEVKEVAESAPKAEEKLPVVKVESAEQLKSKILTSAEDTTKIWYVAPNDTVRYEVSTNNSLNLFRKVSLGITDKDLSQIPVAGSSEAATPISKRLIGRFLLQVESRGETWFVDQLGYKHRVTSQNLVEVTSKSLLGIGTEKLDQIPVGNTAQ